MKKSVIKSMIFGSLVVMLISFLVLTVIIFYNVKAELQTETYARMEEFVEHVEPMTQMSVDFSTSRMIRLYHETMRQFTNFTGFNVLVATPKGDVIWSDVPLNAPKAKESIIKISNSFDEEKLVSDKGILDEIYKKRTITVAKMVTSEVTDSDLYIFCSAPKPNITKGFVLAMLNVMLMELAALAFMAFFLYLFSKNITSPLEKINVALKRFSKGDFSKRVEYNSPDELGELASNVNAMADGLENLEKMRSSFVSDVSHELRTPMTSISGFLEGIIDGTIPKEDSDKYLKIVLSETKRLSRIVNDLLSVSRLDSKTNTLNRTQFDIQELAKIVLLNFENEITAKDISVTINALSKVCSVNGDKDSYTQVLINLIHNAVKFTPNGGRITLSFDETNDKCMVTIKNTGSTIEKDKIAHIWERFYKTDNSRGNDKSGVGLGLYIVKRIIDSHGESIYVSCDEDNTTSFTFSAQTV